jgi:hypothetical protein
MRLIAVAQHRGSAWPRSKKIDQRARSGLDLACTDVNGAAARPGDVRVVIALDNSPLDMPKGS